MDSARADMADDYQMFIEAFCTAKDIFGISSEGDVIVFVGNELAVLSPLASTRKMRTGN